MSSILKTILSVLFGTVVDKIADMFKKKPEQIQKEEDSEKVSATVDAINRNDDGFKLPVGATKDKWDKQAPT